MILNLYFLYLNQINLKISIKKLFVNIYNILFNLNPIYFIESFLNYYG